LRLIGGEGVARERAGEVAKLLESALALPAEAISYEWASTDQPIADDSTAAGRAALLVAVEIWYDDFKDATSTQELVVKNDFTPVKVCRMQTVCKLRYVEGRERRARVQNLVAPLHYDDASLQPTPAFVAQIQRTLETLSDKQHVVTKFIGYTDNAPLAEREAQVYGDHEALSKARARRIAVAIQDELGLPAEAVDSDGHGADRTIASNETSQGQALVRRFAAGVAGRAAVVSV
jgi:outer membrane protein OmpA-like peptidoglycan-associated protein